MAVSDRWTPALREKLVHLPQQPGVYLMKDRKGQIIYIGKAKSLRHRVRSYFQETEVTPRQSSMISRLHDFEYIITDSEVEALILEASLVREQRPRYNVNLKDDKKFPYLKLTNEPFPRLLVTRRVEKDGASYFGPYTEAKKMRALLKMLRKMFPLRTCGARLPDPEEGRTCLYAHIGQCLAPCLGSDSTREAYRSMIRQVGDFLSGHSGSLTADVERKMREAARQEKFEEAARLRDQLQYVQRISLKQKVVSTQKIDRDVIAVARDGGLACGVVLQVRDGKLMGRESYLLNGTKDLKREEILGGFIEQHYLGATLVPQELFLEEMIEDAENTAAWLSARRGRKIRLVVPRRGDKAKLLLLARHNAELLLSEALLKRDFRQEKVPYAVLELQRVLNLKRSPRRIEAFDISNLSGVDAVGSMVAFNDGKPLKSQYRRFRIRSVAGQDDYAMMKEVVERRYHRLMDGKQALPDLILIDGGRGHLSSAMEVLQGLGVTEPDVIGLAKRLEEVYLPQLPDPQTIPKSSPALRLLQHVRDEAHRFAVQYHRTVRKGRTMRSALDDIPGIGPRRRTALLRHFGSLKRVKQASVDEIASVHGINRKVALQVYEALLETGTK